jgi:predicted LPLAT superfamily acyltransferase
MVEGGSRWTSRSIGSNFQHRIFYALIRWGGRRAAYALLYPVVAWYVLCRPLVRARCRPYLEHRFPGRRGFRRLLDSFRMSLALGKSLVDRAVVGILGPAAMRPTVEGREELLLLAQEEKGLILLVAHVGCWQAAMSALKFLGRPVSMLMQREEGDVDRHWFEHAGVACPYRIIDPRGFLGGALEMLEVLKGGGVLSVMGDRLLGDDRNAVTVEFLGGPVRLPYSVYQLASATGAPIAVLLPHKSGPDRYAMRLYEVIRVPSGLGRGAARFEPYARQFAASLEGYCREHPFQFFNFFDLWDIHKEEAQRQPR